MNLLEGPSIVAAALFVSLIFLDLFRQEYKLVPVHAIMGFFAVILMGVLCEKQQYILAWTILLIPFVILTLGIILRQRDSESETPYPVLPIQKMEPKHQPARYFM